ncbi:MAG: helix-turn-helix domain-containing protein [Oscillospiraceae bacterium]|nr:helix-turn-helix domain-containing protein [Oscillospiraceae bacterium]
MKVELTLQEKLRDLRDEKKMTLSDLEKATGIPVSTLQRLEAQEDNRASYQDVALLAKFYNVSTDYLFGLTDNRQYRHIEIDALRLSDSAIGVLKSGNFNNRLISEMISHPDFQPLLSAIEIYIDRKVLPQMNTMNAMYKVVEENLLDKFEIKENDEVIALLQEAIVDEDDYLRYRISVEFNALMKELFGAHKKDALPEEQASVIHELKSVFEEYPVHKENEEKAKHKYMLLAKQIGLNVKDLTDEEHRALIKALEKSDAIKRRRRK